MAAGAGEAEAYASEETGREVRVHGGEVESLTAATQRGIGVRAWLGGRVGYAYGTDSSERASPRSRPGRRRRHGRRTRTSSPGRRRPAPAQPLRGAARPLGRGVADRQRSRSWRSRSSGPRSRPTHGSPGWRRRSTRIRPSGSRSPPRPASPASLSPRAPMPILQALAEGDGGRETGLGFGLARGPAGLDPAAIGSEGAERAAAMIGARKPASRSCPVVLDPTVAASFAALIGVDAGGRRGPAGPLAVCRAAWRGDRQRGACSARRRA